MRNKILSILMACMVGLGILAFQHLMKDETDGQAFASAGLSSSRLDTIQKLPDTSDDLRRSISYTPDNVLKLTGQELRSVLKDPGLVRHESPTTMWQYRTSSCVLDVYFGAGAESAPVAHYEIRAREKGVEDTTVRQNCMRDLVRQQNGFHMVDVSSFYKALAE